MIYNNVILSVKNTADVSAVAALLGQQGTLSRAELGCERFEVYHSETDVRVFILVEQWATQADLDAHRLAPGFTEIYQPKILPLVERTPHLCTLMEEL
ncbi:MAG: quinol monooxygenase YgiN [Candidatus Azotimanducaceae bacterium]|jgi:quinol monooxygenase YgiN